jgi:cytochrome P450
MVPAAPAPLRPEPAKAIVHATPADVPTLALDPFDEAFLADPYPFHVALREAGPLVWLERYGVYAMARHTEVAAALKDWETYASARGVGLQDFAVDPPWRPASLLLEADPPAHGQARAIMNKVVSLASLKALAPAWRDKAERLADELVARRRFDAVTDCAEVFPLMVFPDTIGLPNEGHHHLLPYGNAVFNAYGPRNAVFETTEGPQLDAAVRWVAEVCRRENLRPDGWGAKVFEAADAGLCTEEEAGRLVRSFLSAGVDTTVTAIGNMMLAFASFPEEWRRLHADPTLSKRAFEESLRWDSTVQIFFRTTTRDVEVGGATIPEGRKALLFLAAANRDPRRWDEAERFDIGRLASGHVGFGFGIHQCLGQMVARQEATVLLEALAPRIKAIRLAGEPKRKLNNSTHTLASLPVEIEPA